MIKFAMMCAASLARVDGGGPVACTYTFDNTTGTLFSASAWPTFSAENQSASFTCDAGTTASYYAIPPVEAGPSFTGVVPIEGTKVYYFEVGLSGPEIITGGAQMSAGVALLNVTAFSEVRVSLAAAGGDAYVIQESGAGVLETFAINATPTDYRVGVYVDSSTGKVGVVGASVYGYGTATPLAGAAGFVLGMVGSQTTPDETGSMGVRVYTSPADFTRTPPAGAYDICGNVI